MSQGSGAARRQFGRRDSNVKAYAVLPGQILLPCVIENVSDGGALLRFTDGAAPTQSFRLMIESTDFNIVCEIRHAAPRRVGVRFVRLAEGIALNRYLLRSMTAPKESSSLVVCPVRVMRGASARSVRQLRELVFGPRVPGPAFVSAEGATQLDLSDAAQAAMAKSLVAIAATAVARAA